MDPPLLAVVVVVCLNFGLLGCKGEALLDAESCGEAVDPPPEDLPGPSILTLPRRCAAPLVGPINDGEADGEPGGLRPPACCRDGDEDDDGDDPYGACRLEGGSRLLLGAEEELPRTLPPPDEADRACPPLAPATPREEVDLVTRCDDEFAAPPPPPTIGTTGLAGHGISAAGTGNRLKSTGGKSFGQTESQ